MKDTLNKDIKDNKDIHKVYVVTYWDKNKVPFVNVFDNPLSAASCYRYNIKIHDYACVDQCEVYGSFMVARE